MNKLNVVNIKCGGCIKSITKSLEKIGITSVSVDLDKQEVSFDGNLQLAKEKLSEIGYPEAGSPEANSLLKKTRSYTSCAIGKMG